MSLFRRAFQRPLRTLPFGRGVVNRLGISIYSAQPGAPQIEQQRELVPNRSGRRTRDGQIKMDGIRQDGLDPGAGISHIDFRAIDLTPVSRKHRARHK